MRVVSVGEREAAEVATQEGKWLKDEWHKWVNREQTVHLNGGTCCVDASEVAGNEEYGKDTDNGGEEMDDDGSSGNFVRLSAEDIRGHGPKRKHASADRARSLEALGIGTGTERDPAEVLDYEYHKHMEVDGAGDNLTGQGGDTVVAVSPFVRALC